MAALELIVEGDGDQSAVPILVRAHLAAIGRTDLDVGRPINAKGRGNLLRDGQLERWLRLAATRDGVRGVLVVCDAERDLACELGPRLSRRCEDTLPHLPVRLTLAVRQFENWIVASAPSTNGDDHHADDYEMAAAAQIIRSWRSPRSYVKPLHQPGYAARIDPTLTSGRCPSFARFLRCVEELAEMCPVADFADGGVE